MHPERENSGYAYEKRAPVLRWYGAPEWLIRPRLHDVVQQHAVLLDTNTKYKSQFVTRHTSQGESQSFTEIRFDDWHFLLTDWHFLLMGNGVFTCYSNWPVHISLSRAKLIKIPRKWRQKNHSEGSRGPSNTAGPRVAYPPSRRPCIDAWRQVCIRLTVYMKNCYWMPLTHKTNFLFVIWSIVVVSVALVSTAGLVCMVW